MRTSRTWLVVSCFSVILLVLTSCSSTTPTVEEKPAPTSEETPKPSEEQKPVSQPESKAGNVKLTLKKLDGTVVEKTVESPLYGGTFSYGLASSPVSFDRLLLGAPSLIITNECLFQAPWERGPQGTGEADYAMSFRLTLGGTTAGLKSGDKPNFPFLSPMLAESWEWVDPDTWIFHLRKGVRFHDKPPTNGREMTADDVAFSSYLWLNKSMYPTHSSYPARDALVYAKALDKYTVEIKQVSGLTDHVYSVIFEWGKVFPRDAFEKYGGLGDWRNSVGTGPFILADYVPSSVLTFKKNPNYWQKDPLHPQNQLPYVDILKWVIIPDVSTRIAALRTGKLDNLGAGHAPVGWEDARSLKKNTPELKYIRAIPGTALMLMWRLDTKPFDDIRVRKALIMSVDRKAILDTFYGGEGVLQAWPTPPDVPEVADCYVPVEKMPDSIREIYEYNPENAKKLLAEAGYPNGFTTEAICQTTEVDLLSIVKDNWAKIGVNLELKPREPAVYTSIKAADTQKHMITHGLISTSQAFVGLTRQRPDNNHSMVADSRIDQAYLDVTASFFNFQEKARVIREITPYTLGIAAYLPLPVPYSYTFWQPWVKGYSGELSIFWGGSGAWPKYIWIDQELKYRMTGKR